MSLQPSLDLCFIAAGFLANRWTKRLRTLSASAPRAFEVCHAVERGSIRQSLCFIEAAGWPVEGFRADGPIWSLPTLRCDDSPLPPRYRFPYFIPAGQAAPTHLAVAE